MNEQRLIYVKSVNKSKFWNNANADVKGYNNFPDTTKSYPVLWDFDEHKFKFTDLTDEEVKSLAKKCKLSYEDGEDEGKPIETVDLHHSQDAFFNHTSLTLKIKDDITTFNIHNPLDKLKLAAFKSYPFVSHSSNSIENTPGAKWVIIDKAVESTEKTDKYIEEKNLWKFFVGTEKEKLSADQMRAIIFAFNDSSMLVDAETPADTMAAMLIEKAKSTVKVNGMSERSRFMMLAGLPKNELLIRELVGRAWRFGVLRKTGDKWLYSGSEIANSTEALYKKLLSPENSATLTAIQEELSLKSK
jgi:hypothetical protein